MSTPGSSAGNNPYAASEPVAGGQPLEELPGGGLLITCALVEEDILRYCDHWIVNNPTLRRARRRMYLMGMLLLVMGGVCLVLEIATPRRGGLLTMVGGAGLALGGTILLMATMQRYSSRSLTRKMLRDGPAQNILGNQSVAITPEGIRIDRQYVYGGYRWEAVDQIASDKWLICLSVGPNTAVIVPRRDFTSPDDAERFLETARHYHQQATNRSALPQT